MHKKSQKANLLIIGMICLIIAGIWLFKNMNNDKGAAVLAVPSDFELEVTQNIDMDKLKSYGLPIIIDFGSDSCVSCKVMAPILALLNSELRGRAIVRFVDVWKYNKLANGFPVRVIPTQIFVDKDGRNYIPSDAVSKVSGFNYAEIGGAKFTYHEGGLEEEVLRQILAEMGMK